MCHFWHVIALVGYEKQTNTGVRGKNREKNHIDTVTKKLVYAAIPYAMLHTHARVFTLGCIKHRLP